MKQGKIERIWEHWKASGMDIDSYIDWLSEQQLSFMSFQRTAHHYRLLMERNRQRNDASTQKTYSSRYFYKSELAILDAVYARFGRHYGWFRLRVDVDYVNLIM